MTTKSMRAWLVALVAFVVVVVAVDSTGVVSDDTAVVVDDTAQLTAGLAATLACWWRSRRTHGHERAWRVLMAVGMAGWSIGQCFWSWYQIFSDTPLPSPSWADVGYLTMPVLALPALLSLAVNPSRQVAEGQRHSSVVFFLDALVVVGSLFVLTWATSLGAVVDSVAPSALAFAVALAYPVTDLVLVVIVVLLTVTRRVSQQSFVQLGLLGSGLVAISVSDSIFAYLISSGADEMPPITNAGFIGGPLLIALAGSASPEGAPERRHVPLHAGAARAHLLLPYALVLLTGSVIAIQSLAGAHIDRVEATLAWVVLNLVIIRQMVTLLQNTALLERVSAAQAELAHRAHHDPLTGLANRALFSERLRAAVDRHRHDRADFALVVVDLDDFKTVNDGFGHNTGDLLLHAVGERLRQCVRGSDTVARLGGDEFAVVLDGGVERPEVVSHRILAALQQPFEIDGATLSVSASLGVVEPGGDDTDLTADVVLRRADGAMYLGKRRGKGVAVHYRPELAGELPFPTILPERPAVAPATP